MNRISLLVLLTGIGCWAQDQPEVFILPIDAGEPINVSQDAGYDNQPFFIDNQQLIFAGTNGDQTDIATYRLDTATKEFVQPPTPGGEYSPQGIPGGNDIAAVRLDPDGKQRLYRYSSPDYDKSTEWIPELQVAYYAFHSDSLILATVLSGSSLDLVLANNKNGQVDTLLTKAGRSIHKVPDSDAMSYTAVNEQGNYDIYQLDIETQESYFVAQLPVGIQDHIWLSDSLLLLGSRSTLYTYDLFGGGSWEVYLDLSKYGIAQISRLAISPDGKHLAFAAVVQSKE